MISAIFTTVGEALTSFSGVLASAVQAVIAMFYNAEQGGMTFLGVLLLIGVGSGLIYWGFNLIRSLIRRA